jgi:hypothetical protein
MPFEPAGTADGENERPRSRRDDKGVARQRHCVSRHASNAPGYRAAGIRARGRFALRRAAAKCPTKYPGRRNGGCRAQCAPSDAARHLHDLSGRRAVGHSRLARIACSEGRLIGGGVHGDPAPPPYRPIKKRRDVDHFSALSDCENLIRMLSHLAESCPQSSKKRCLDPAYLVVKKRFFHQSFTVVSRTIGHRPLQFSEDFTSIRFVAQFCWLCVSCAYVSAIVTVDKLVTCTFGWVRSDAIAPQAENGAASPQRSSDRR